VSTFRFRVPGRSQPVGAWLAALFPDVARRDRRAWIEERRLSIEGTPCDRGTAPCAPGAEIVLALPEATLEDVLPAAAAIEATQAEVWEAVVATCPWSAGRAGEDLAFEVLEQADGLARLVVRGPATRGAEVLWALAELGLPVVGDLIRGGRAVVASEAGVAPGPLVRPDGGEVENVDLAGLAASLWRWDHDDEAPGRLVVSVETGRVLAGGHPWILPDDASDRADRYRPGALVEVEDRSGRSQGWARIEGTRAIAARLWVGAGAQRGGDSVEARIAKALARRGALLALPSSDTSCFRLVHGEGDALPGLFVDRLGPLLRVLVSGQAALAVRERVVDALTAQLPVTPEGLPFSVLEVLHLRTPARGRVDATRWRRGGLDLLREQGALVGDEPALVGHERGLAFELDPGWASPRRPRPGYGLFVDQRENRARLAQDAAHGGRWLNLFAHTGAFSVALLAAGAEAVTSVDLSAPYLARLERNLALNVGAGVDPARHESFRGDARRALEESGGELRGIVVDPPTAAAAGRRFWSVREDLEPLLRACIERLGDGGRLLVTQNRAGPPLGLDLAIERTARRLHREVAALEPASAGPDHPSRPEFPEGVPFEGVLLTLR
ncbi:unnamed protein product, partial [Discosporangium mesarthrocarpum]